MCPRRSSTRPSKRGIPLFEVPYEMPFIAITERAFARLVNEQYAVLERGARVHEKLERLVIEGAGSMRPRLARGRRRRTAIVQDAGGRELAAQPRKGGPRAAAMKALERDRGPQASGRHARSSRVRARWPSAPRGAVPAAAGGSPVAWLVGLSQQGRLGEFER
jgi:purine catabolism regulator